MKKKYLIVFFYEALAGFDSVLTDKQKEGFFSKYPGLKWIEKEEEIVEKKLNSTHSVSIEQWIYLIVDYLAEYENWYKERINICKC